MNDKLPNLEILSGALADRSKLFLGFAIICQLAILSSSILVLVLTPYTEWIGLVAAILAIVYVLLQWRSDTLRRMADSVKRKNEVFDGMGWPPSGKEFSDLKVTIPDNIRRDFWKPVRSNYYDSDTAPSPLRVIENLEESSWWSKHLSQSMMGYSGAFCTVVVMLAIITLLITLQNASGQTYEQNIARAMTSVIVFLFSAGYLRLTFEYFRFGREAQRIEDQAIYLKKQADLSSVDALKLLHDYQIIRAGAPLIPTWLWKMKNSKLNDAWDERKRLSC